MDAFNNVYLETRLADELEGLEEVQGDHDDELRAQGRIEMLHDLINALAGEAE